MKKSRLKWMITLIISVIIIIILSTFIFFNETGLKKISYDKFLSLMSNSGYYIVYYGQEECSACNSVFPFIKEESKKLNIDVLYLDADGVEDNSELEKLNIYYTPTIIVIDNGDVRIYDDVKAGNIKNILLKSQPSVVDRPYGLTDISYDDLMKKMSSKCDFILYIGRDDCRDCKKFHPIIKEYNNDNKTVGAYYFNIKNFRNKSMVDNAKEEDTVFYENLKEKFDIQWVPSVYHIINGQIISKYEFLSEQYYEIEDETERKNIEKKFIDDFNTWLDAAL